ncbi:hypothetical protein JKF63_04138 [Porcisia hertigi]|uniref:Uncharacterized protein n=1 Tax=Porcisia hertigi TaxID=2761500 RepID=A0A836ISG1_9TRYP|nr:hypothetical protein JKF63_04138 [Porcisia hertigi]
MAVPEGRSIYEVMGTVLYCTVPVNIDDADSPNLQRRWQQQQQLGGDANVPLDYDAALALREIDEAVMAERYLATKVKGPAFPAADRAVSRDGVVIADRVSPGKKPSMSIAAPHPAPVSSQRPGTLPSVPALYSASGSGGAPPAGAKTTQHAKSGGSISNNSLSASVKIGAEVGGGQRDPSEPFDTAVQNAYFVKTRMRTAAAAAAAQTKTGRCASTLSCASRGAYNGIDGYSKMTVAQAMEILFPVEAVGPSGGSQDDSDKSGEAGTGDAGPTPTASASPSRVPAAAVTLSATNNSSAPVLWRRADVAHLSRLDVVLLYKHLQHRCASESARPRGVVCPNRERIYNDGLRELIRQVTLLCPERGLLLDELARNMRQSIETYDVLLDSASQYAVRKSTERDLYQHLFAEKAALEMEVRRREHRVSEWRAKYAGLQKRFQEQQDADSKLHAEEIAYAKRVNLQIVNEIKRLATQAEKAKTA